MKRAIQTDNAPPPKGMPYSQGVVSDDLIFTAGQIPLLPDGTMLDKSFGKQTARALENIEAILSASGTTLADVVKVTIYLTNMDDYPTFNEVYGTFFTEPYPAREVVCVKELPLGASIEISAVARRSSS